MTSETPETMTAESDAAEAISEQLPSRSNVGRRERIVSTVLGGALVARGLKRRSVGGVASAIAGGALVYRGLTGRSRLYRALESDITGDQEGLHADESAQLPTVERSITVGESADVLADHWRDPAFLSRIVGDFAEVSEVGEDRHRWRVQAPFDRTLEWETTIIEDEANNELRWTAEEGTLIPHECTISFRETANDRGTTITFELRYDPPGGAVGNTALDQLGFAPEMLVGTALRRFKSLAETGEIPTTEANPSARGNGNLV